MGNPERLTSSYKAEICHIWTCIAPPPPVIKTLTVGWESVGFSVSFGMLLDFVDVETLDLLLNSLFA